MLQNINPRTIAICHRFATQETFKPHEAIALLRESAMLPRGVRGIAKDRVEGPKGIIMRLDLTAPHHITKGRPCYVDLYYLPALFLGLAFGGRIYINGRTGPSKPDYRPYLRATVEGSSLNLTVGSLVRNVGTEECAVPMSWNSLDCSRLGMRTEPRTTQTRQNLTPRAHFIEAAVKASEPHLKGNQAGNLTPDLYRASLLRWFEKADSYFMGQEMRASAA